MNQLIGRRDRPISCDTIKEVTTQDGSRRIELWRATFAGVGHNVAMYYLDLHTHSFLDNRWVFDDLSDALDKYYDLIQGAYKYGHAVSRVLEP